MTPGALVFCLVLLATATTRSAYSSSAEVSKDESTGELIISVVSSRPETTFSGRIGQRNNFGYASNFRMNFAAGEEFCVYMPVLGMRNFSCAILALKYWDMDAEIELSNSEGDIIGTSKLVAAGRRPPVAAVHFYEIPRPDIVQLCVRNTGSTKNIALVMHLTNQKDLMEFLTLHTALGESHNISAESIIRMDNLLLQSVEHCKASMSLVVQDYFRLSNIQNWVDGRGIAGSLAMLLCSGMSTLVIRRWFGSPRSTV